MVHYSFLWISFKIQCISNLSIMISFALGLTWGTCSESWNWVAQAPWWCHNSSIPETQRLCYTWPNRRPRANPEVSAGNRLREQSCRRRELWLMWLMQSAHIISSSSRSRGRTCHSHGALGVVMLLSHRVHSLPMLKSCGLLIIGVLGLWLWKSSSLVHRRPWLGFKMDWFKDRL